jgi:hypothetical protein
MLRKLIDAKLLASDDAEAGGSSAPAAPAATGTSTAAPTQEPKTIADVARQAYESSTKDDSGSHEKSESDSDTDDKEIAEVPKEDETPAEEQEPSTEEGEQPGDEVEKPKSDATTDPDANLPFHNHPRWKEVIEQKKTFEQQATVLKQELESVKPVKTWADNHFGFMQQHGITEQEFTQAMNFLALQKSDPAKALEVFKPVWDSLQVHSADYMPPDIAKMVEENELTPAAAKIMAKQRQELEQFKRGQAKSKQDQGRQQLNAINSAATAWETAKRGMDPDFKPKTEKEDVDGLWEMTMKNYAYLNTVDYADTPQKATGHFETAYAEAKELVKRLRGNKPTAARPSTMRSSTAPTPKGTPKTVDDVVRQAVAKHGIKWGGRVPVND